MIDPLNSATLESARKKAGLSRAQLAQMAGVNTATVFRIEKGEIDPHLGGTWAPIVKALQGGGS